MISPLVLLRMRIFSDKSCRENQKKHFVFFSWSLWDDVETYVQDRVATDINIKMRLRIACWITKTTDTHLEYIILTDFPRSSGYTNAPLHVVFNYFEATGHTEGARGIISFFSFLVCSFNGTICVVIRLWDEKLTNITSITNGQRNVSLLKIFQTHIPTPPPLCHKVVHRGHFKFALLLSTSSAGRIFRYGE